MKAKTAKPNFLKELQEAVDQVNQAKRGKIKLKSTEALLDELQD